MYIFRILYYTFTYLSVLSDQTTGVWENTVSFNEPVPMIIWQPLEICRMYFYDAKLFIDSLPAPIEQSKIKRARKLTKDICGTIIGLQELWVENPEIANDLYPAGYSFANYDLDHHEMQKICRNVEQGLEKTIYGYCKLSDNLSRLGTGAIEDRLVQGFNQFRGQIANFDDKIRQKLSSFYKEDIWFPKAKGRAYLSGEETLAQMEIARSVYDVLISKPAWSAKAEASRIASPFREVLYEYTRFRESLEKLINIATDILVADATGQIQMAELEHLHPETSARHANHIRDLSGYIFDAGDLNELRQTISFVVHSSFKVLYSEARLAAREGHVKSQLKSMLDTPEWNEWRQKGTPLKGRWTQII